MRPLVPTARARCACRGPATFAHSPGAKPCESHLIRALRRIERLGLTPASVEVSMRRRIQPRLALAVLALALVAAALPGAAVAAAGALDPTFGIGGEVTTDFGGSDSAQAVAIQSDGKILAAGLSGAGDFALARYNADGSLDPSFGSGGKVTTDFGGFDLALGVALQSDGKIVAAGQGGSSFDFALARYNADGSLDTSFGSGGKVTTDFGVFDAATAVAIQRDGKIVATGSTFSSGFQQFALARYNADGSLDT